MSKWFITCLIWSYDIYWCPNKALLMSTHYICFHGEIRKMLSGYPLLSGTMCQAHIDLKFQGYHESRIKYICPVFPPPSELPLLGLIKQTSNWWYFSYFCQKIGFDISCRFSSKETIYLKCKSLFSGKNKTTISKCRLIKFATFKKFIIFVNFWYGQCYAKMCPGVCGQQRPSLIKAFAVR